MGRKAKVKDGEESLIAEDEQVGEEKESRTAQVMAGETVANIKKKWGGNMLIKASDERYQNTPRISSGIFALDWALGGGWAAGRINTIYGPKSAAKTTTMNKTVAQAQKLCGNCMSPRDLEGRPNCTPACTGFREIVCAYIDVESTWDANWAKKNGVDLERLMFCKPEFAEQSLDILEALIRSADVDVIVLDSLAFLTPAKEIEESTAKETVGVQARLLGKGTRKFVAALAAIKNEHSRWPTIFFTNQIRMKVGVMFGNPETQSGGLAPQFAATSEVKLWSGKYEMDEKTGRPIHADMNFRVEKNKSDVPKMEGSFRLMLTSTETKQMGDIYEEDTMVDLAHKFGLVEGHGNSWTCLGEKYAGKSMVERRLLTDPPYKAMFRQTLMKILLAV